MKNKGLSAATKSHFKLGGRVQGKADGGVVDKVMDSKVMRGIGDVIGASVDKRGTEGIRRANRFNQADSAPTEKAADDTPGGTSKRAMQIEAQTNAAMPESRADGGKVGKHQGFKKVQAKIEGEGYSPAAAGAILASSTRKASASAKAANPRLRKVK